MPLLRQREDDSSKWDVLHDDGTVGIVDTPQAYVLQKRGAAIGSGEDWDKATRGAESSRRAGAVDAKLGYTGLSGAKNITMRPAGAGYVAEAETEIGPQVVELTPEEASTLQYERGDATQVLGAGQVPQRQAPPARAAPTPARPRVSVQQVGDAGPVPGFRSLAQYAPGMADTPPEEAISNGRVAGSTMSAIQPTDSLEIQRGQGGDAEFAAAQDEARRRRLMLGISQAGSSFNEALSGVGAKKGFYEGLGEDADLPVRELVAKRAADKQRRLSDPTSEESRRLQMAVAKAMPRAYTPEQLAQITAADEAMVLRTGEMADALAQRADDRAREDAALKAKIAREDAQRAEDHKWRTQSEATQRAHQIKLAGMNNAADLSQAMARATLGANATKLAERGVGGYTFDPANPPSAAAAKQMADTTIAKDKILGSLSQLESLYDQHGSELFGDDAGTMESAWMDVTNALRNVNGMGVPNGADYLMLAKQLQDPTSLAALRTSTPRAKAQIKELKRQVAQTVDATARALKFTPEAQPQRVPAVSGAEIDQQPTAPQRIQKNGKTYEFENGQWYEVD